LQGEPVELDDEILDYIVEAYRIDPTTGAASMTSRS
jgi:hypothetical protein